MTDGLFGMWVAREAIESILSAPAYTAPSPEVAAWVSDTRPLKDRFPQWLHVALEEDARKLAGGVTDVA